MKIKDFTPKKRSRRKRYALSVALLFMLAAALLTFSISSLANGTFRAENCNNCEVHSQKLGKEINAFIELDTDPKKTVSSQVTAAINEYRKQIIDLQSHPEVEKRSLENEIQLAYTKGNAAGRIAWVYYYNIYTFESSTSVDKINAKYASCKNAIASATQHTVLSPECEVMLDELNKLILSERAKNLALPSDSLSASSLISGTIERFKNIYSADLFGVAYAEAYAELVDELGLQRVRDALKSEAEQIFKQISPNESFLTSTAASLLIYELNNSQSIKAMNNATIDFVEALLSIDTKKPYSSLAKSSFLKLSQDAASRATESQTAARLVEIFKDYTLTIKKAEIKDSVYAVLLGNGSAIDERLLELEQSFNCDGGIIDQCKTDAEVDAELINAKSALFIYKHQSILEKSFDELEITDESIARSAIIEYSALEEKVKQKLVGEINIIAEKYNNILIKRICSYLPNDALYLDFCEIIAKEIKSVPRESIDDFYNRVSRIPLKAEALSIVVSEYRGILSASNYKDYNEIEKENLLAILTSLSSELGKINPADVAIYTDEIIDLQASAIRSLNIIDQSARVRIAARSSNNADILNELKIAQEKISLCSEKSEMILQANRAIYKIERLLTSDAILHSCEQLKTNIMAMDFLENIEKESFCNLISALEINAKNAKEAGNLTALENIWIDFCNSLNAIKNEAEAIDLSRAISSYIEKISNASKVQIENLNSLEYIAKEKSDEIYNSIIAEESSAKQDIPLCKSTAAVITRYAEFLESLNNLQVLAKQWDLNGYKQFLILEFDQYEKIKANYSAENYNKISDIKQSTINKLAAAASKEECDAIVLAAHNEILLINDLLDDERDNALASLLTLLESLKKDSPLYSTENFSKIEGLYDEAKIEIQKINDIANIAQVKQVLTKYVNLIREIRKDSIYTSESAHIISTPALQYPNDFDYSSGLLGSIHLSNGLVSDATFSINLIELSRNKQVEELIKKSAKQGSLITFQSLPNNIQKLLRSSSVAATIDITLSSVAEGASGYTVQMLIPNELNDENILGLAFVRDDKVEFYPIKQADSLISVKLEHFSKFYIVVESTLNVQPLLIALIILLMLEFLTLIGILYLRFKRKNEELIQSQNDFPELPMSALIPFTPLLTRIYPENGLPLTILLSIAALALASTIVLLVRKETIEKRENDNVKKQKMLNGKENQMLLGEGKYSDGREEIFFNNNENKELCVVGASQKRKSNKVELDLDVISAKFKEGDVVNLQALKQRGLVDENTDYIKILTKGSLIKPLTIEANEFSNAARDIVELSGGEIRKI